MLGLRRKGLTLVSRKGFAAVTAQTSASDATISAVTLRSEEVNKKRNNNNGHNKTFNHNLLSVEQLRLQKKHGEQLQNTQLKTLHDTVEYIEWRGIVYTDILDKICKMLDTTEEVASLSDRQLSVILSAFGSLCDTCSRSKREQFLEKAVQSLNERGVRLGVQSTNTLIEARLANKSNIDVVRELRAMEEAGVDADSKSYALFCEAYARQGNTPAIMDIISHMNSSDIILSEDHVTQLVYSIARSGNDSRVEAVMTKFASNMNAVRLRCAAARAIIEREKNEVGRGGFEVTEALRAIPTTAKLHMLDNNVHILAVLMDLIEAGQTEAFQLLSAYLMLSEDGSSVSEKHNNGMLMARARCLLDENKLAESLALFSCIHPSFTNKYYEKDIKYKLYHSVKHSKEEQLDSLVRIVVLAEKKGLIENANEFLLTSSIESSSFGKVFEHVRSSGGLKSILAGNSLLKKHISKKLGHKLIKTPSPSAQSTLLADIATVLFAPSKEETLSDILSYYPIVFRLGASDVKLAIPALREMSDYYAKREYSTALLHQLLRSVNDDHLVIEKISQLLESKAVDSVNAVRLQNLMAKFISRAEGKGDDSDDVRRKKSVAKMIALDFPQEGVRFPVRFAPKNLARFLANDLISDDIASDIVTYLESENRVGLTKEEIEDAKEMLKSNPKKAKLVERLKKSQTMARWRSSNVEDLLKEHDKLCSENVKEAIVDALRDVILGKTKNRLDDLDFVVNVLEQSKEWRQKATRGNRSHRSTVARDLESSALSRALVNNDIVIADRIWGLKSVHLFADVTLSYASRLFLNNQEYRADAICADLRSSAQQIHASTLERMGRRLRDVEVGRVNDLAAYLGKQFNLPQKQTRRVVSQAKLDQLTKLIERDDVSSALRLAVEETKESGRAFGQIPLMIEAIRRNDRKLLEDVHVMVRNVHDTHMANLDLAYALVEAGHVKQAKQLVEKQNLDIGDRVLQYFITLAVSNENARVLRAMFSVFNGRASTLQLNNLLELLTRMMWKKEDMEGLLELENEIETSSFPLQNKLRRFFDNLRMRDANLEE